MKFNRISSQLIKINKHLIPNNCSSAFLGDVHNTFIHILYSFLDNIKFQGKSSGGLAKIQLSTL